MSYYIDKSLPNGDRDDYDDERDVTEPEISEEVKKKLQQEKLKKTEPLVKKTGERKKSSVEQKVKKIVLPKAFDDDWYNNKIEKAKGEQNYYNAKKFSLLKSYENIVYHFYTQLMFKFNVENNIIDMPEYIKNAGNTECDLEQLATILNSREDALLQFFKRDVKKLNSELNSVHYEQLKKFAVKSWLMYYSMQKFGNLTSHLKFMNTYVENNTADITNKPMLANCYRLHKKAEYRMKNVKNFFNYYKKGIFSKEHPTICPMYQDVNSEEYYNELLNEVGGYVVSENQEKMQYVKSKIYSGVEKLIVELYDNYEDAKYVRFKLNSIYQDVKNGDNYAFIYEDLFYASKYKTTDLYERAKQYVSICERILVRLDIKSRLFEEVNSLYEELQEVIELNRGYHYLMVEVELKEIEDRKNDNKI